MSEPMSMETIYDYIWKITYQLKYGVIIFTFKMRICVVMVID